MSIVLFILLLAIAVFFFIKRVFFIKHNIFLGRKPVSINTEHGWKNVLLFSFGQKKMFKKPLVAVIHLVIYVGFFIINIEVLEILIDGLFSQHRIFLSYVPVSIYRFFINVFEALAVGVILVCVIFLIRRNITNVKRLISKDLSGWPKTDANLILIFEIILMSLFLSMNATDTLLQERNVEPYITNMTGDLLFSSQVKYLFYTSSSDILIVLERIFWWLHIAGILFFLVYVTYSKHLHIFLAFPSAFYSGNQNYGTMDNMKNIQREVAMMLNPNLDNEENQNHGGVVDNFGAKDVRDLSWKQIMDAYACTECGRCSAVCPANITGKKLSPRKIMMAVRDRAEEVGKLAYKKSDSTVDNKTLINDYISEEELKACTTCQACIEECPVQLNPLSIILDLRRNLVMEQSKLPQEWVTISTNMENNSAPWQFSNEEKENWLRNH